MEKKEILEKLREKLDRNMDSFLKAWWQTTSSVLVGKAQEISATQTAYNEVYGGEYSTDLLEFLLRFENPLEVVRDKWLEENALPLHEEMTHSLWTIMNSGDAESDYKLDEEYTLPKMEVSM